MAMTRRMSKSADAFCCQGLRLPAQRGTPVSKWKILYSQSKPEPGDEAMRGGVEMTGGRSWQMADQPGLKVRQG